MDNKNFLIKSINNADYETELAIIGFDNSYIHKAKLKSVFKNLKIYGLTSAQANIMKQTALSVGADCLTHRDVITGNIEKSDVILSGTLSQLEKISDKLKQQPFSLSKLSEGINNQLFEKKCDTKLVGILNITEDSFSDGGEYNTLESACRKLDELVNDGSDIVDIGAESTKPGASEVPSEVQLKKILPVLDYARRTKIKIPISIDTRSSIVADECLKNGASLINDVSGMKFDNELCNVVAKHDATLILQHSLGNSINMAENHVYDNIIDDVFKDLYKQTELAKTGGIKKIIIDPGIGFDKTREDNFEVLNRIEDFYSLGYPVMVGVSRKSLLNMNNATNEKKDIFTLALNSMLIAHKVDFIRVHNVKLHREFLDLVVRSD